MLVTVAWFMEPWEAHIARGRLEAEGVRAFIVHEHHIWGAWMYANALGCVKLQVVEPEAEVASAILGQHFAGEFEANLEFHFGPLPPPQCTSCGSESRLTRVTLSDALAAFAVFFTLGVAYPPPKSDKCGYCGNRRFT